MKFVLVENIGNDEEVLEWNIKLSANGVTLFCKKKYDPLVWSILSISEKTGEIYLHRNVPRDLGLKLGREDKVSITNSCI